MLLLTTIGGLAIFGWSFHALELGLYVAGISLVTSTIVLFMCDCLPGDCFVSYLLGGLLGGSSIIAANVLTFVFVRIMFAIIGKPLWWLPAPLTWSIGVAIFAHLFAIIFTAWKVQRENNIKSFNFPEPLYPGE